VARYVWPEQIRKQEEGRDWTDGLRDLTFVLLDAIRENALHFVARDKAQTAALTSKGQEVTSLQAEM
jgi:hypothetical protein